MTTTIENYIGDQPSSDLVTETGSAELPFVHLFQADESTCCYAIASMIRYNRHYTLLGGQVALFSTPTTGYFNPELEWLIYVLVAQLSEATDGKFHTDIVCAGKPDSANQSLHLNSALYRIHADSCIGFCGTSTKNEKVWPLERSHVHAMVTADNLAGCSGEMFVPPDNGVMPFTPRFYRRAERTEAGGYEQWDVTSQQWIWLMPVIGQMITRPFTDRYPSLAREMRDLECKLAAFYSRNEDIYVGTRTMMPKDGDILLQPEVRELLEQRHDTRHGLDALMDLGIEPQFTHLARVPSDTNARNTALRRTLNASGIYNWNLAL